MSFLLAAGQDRPFLSARRGPLAPAAARGRFAPYAAGCVVVVLLYVVFSLLAGAILVVAAGGEGADLTTLPTLPLGSWGPAATLALLLSPSVALLVCLWGVTRVLHGRAVATLVRADGRPRWGRAGLGALVWAGAATVYEGVGLLLYPDAYSVTFDAARFLPLLVVALLLVPLQCAAEELLFRGYLLQGLGFTLRRGWAALVVTSVLFAAVHLGNPELERFGGAFVLYYAGIGAVLCLATLLDDGLEVAIGAHTANNLWGALLVSFPGSVLDTPALLRMDGVPPAVMATLGGATAVTALVVLGILLRWRGRGSALGRVERLRAMPTVVPDTAA